MSEGNDMRDVRRKKAEKTNLKQSPFLGRVEANPRKIK